MYLVAGMVARSVAGPGVIVSFVIAAIASIFSGKFSSLFLLPFNLSDQNLNFVF